MRSKVLSSSPRRVTALVSSVILAVSMGCTADSFPTAPEAQPAAPAAAQPGLLGNLFGSVDELLRCPTTESHTTTQSVGPGGGVLTVGPHSLIVPQGVLEQPVTITATAPAGDYVRVELEPHGLQFDKALSLRLSYAQCGLLGTLRARVVYVDDGFTILQRLPSANDIFDRQVTGKLKHFSSYALAF